MARSFRLLGVFLIGSVFGSSGCVGELAIGDGETRVRVDSGSIGLMDGGTADSGRDAGTDTATDTRGSIDCGDERLATAVYNGTREPTHLPLNSNQVLAIGHFPSGCSGTLIAPTWVLSAQHCGLRRGAQFCMGTDPANPNVCFNAINVYNAPRGGDMTLLEIEDARGRLPDVQPIPILTEAVTGYMGRTAEAAGYGQTESGGFGTRFFTAQPIVQVRGDFLSIDGMGVRGVCFGDSGGPVMVLDGSGSVRVAGDLSHGDPSCLGVDQYTRVDIFRDFIESHTGPTMMTEPEPMGCGTLTATGRCMDNQAIWCEADEVRTERCDGMCGYDADAGGYRCIEAMSDPCMGIDAFGVCERNVARWCDGGELRSRDCNACGQTCRNSVEYGGMYCVD